MPTFILHIPIDFHKLLQNSRITAGAFRSESCRVMEMTIDISFVFVIRVLRTE